MDRRSLTVYYISDTFSPWKLVKIIYVFVSLADAVDHCSSPSQSGHSPAGLANKQHSLRGANKLTRRARSFKEDFLEKLSQIRTPTNTLSLGRYERFLFLSVCRSETRFHFEFIFSWRDDRSHSPNSPRNKLLKGNHSLCSTDDAHAKPVQDLNYHVRQVKNALQHFKDVIAKNKLEMLPGNGTIVLESIANVHTALQSYTLNENSSAIISATTQVYLSLGKLIKLCDEVLLSDTDTHCASLSRENVTEVVELVENAVQVWNDNASESEIHTRIWKSISRSHFRRIWCKSPMRRYRSAISSRRHRMRRTTVAIHCNGRWSIWPVNVPRCRTFRWRRANVIFWSSRKRNAYEHRTAPRVFYAILVRRQNPHFHIGTCTHATSWPCALDCNPFKCHFTTCRLSNPPPLPPKRRSQHSKSASGSQSSSSTVQNHQQQTPSIDVDVIIDSTLLSCGLDRMSLRSKSPDDNSSLLSTSSLDSALNHSREEDELKALTTDSYNCDEHTLKEDIDKFFAHSKWIIALPACSIRIRQKKQNNYLHEWIHRNFGGETNRKFW